ALIADPEIEAVLLLASGSQRDNALAALAAGKHLFSEKPLGYGLRETEDIAAAAARAPGVAMIGYHKRYDPAYLRARAAVRALADLRHVQVTVLHPDDGEYRRHHELAPRRPSGPAMSAADIERAVIAEATAPAMAAQVVDIAGADAPL